MLLDDTSTVDAHDGSAGESLADDAEGLSVEVGLGIGGAEHGSVDDEEVGVGGWQPFALADDGAGMGSFMSL